MVAAKIDIDLVCSCGFETTYFLPHSDIRDAVRIDKDGIYICCKCGREMKIRVSQKNLTTETDVIAEY